jgi:hypothetical protein
MGDFQFDPHSRGDNGHLGLRNMIAALGTGRFVRVSLGIGSIPSDQSQWEEFFNGELSADAIGRVQSCFNPALEQLVEYMTGYIQIGGVTNAIAVSAQLPERMRNLPISPVIPVITSREAHYLDRAVTVLIRVIQETAKAYARAVHDNEYPQGHPLVALLERGVPWQMVPLVRTTQFHIDHFGFDFQSDRLVEINAAPYPPLLPGRVTRLMGLNSPGMILTPEILTERVRILANRHHKGDREGRVHFLNKVGEVSLGWEGWHNYVRHYLEELGYTTSSGGPDQEADVIWANLTWMTPERWLSVLTSKVFSGKGQVFPSPRNFLFTSKYFMCLLSSPLGRRVLRISRADAEVLDRFIPWTRILTEETDTVKMLLRHGQRLYAKPFLSSGGRGGSMIRQSSDFHKADLPAVVQEWVQPYEIASTDYRHDVRIVVYGPQGNSRIWQARVWEGSSTLSAPMDAPIRFVR